MSLKLADRVRETTTSTGTGFLALEGSLVGYQSFASALSDLDTCYYCVENGAQWEVGQGRFLAISGRLLREDVFASSTGSLLDLTEGTKQVFIVLPAKYALHGWYEWPFLGRRFYDSGHGMVAGRVGQSAFPSGRMIFCPFLQTDLVPRPFNSIGVEVRIATISGRARIALYSDVAGKPGDLIVDAGEILTASTGYASRPLELLLDPGMYWMAIAVNTSTTLRNIDNRNGLAMLGYRSATDITPSIMTTSLSPYPIEYPTSAPPTSPLTGPCPRVMLGTGTF